MALRGVDWGLTLGLRGLLEGSGGSLGGSKTLLGAQESHLGWVFGLRPRRGRSPVEHRGNLYVRPSVQQVYVCTYTVIVWFVLLAFRCAFI